MKNSELYRLAAAASLVLVQGCTSLGTEFARDRRDAPWDPADGRALFEQIPNWDSAAERRCCGHLRQCQPHQTARC